MLVGSDRVLTKLTRVKKENVSSIFVDVMVLGYSVCGESVKLQMAFFLQHTVVRAVSTLVVVISLVTKVRD